MSEDNDLGVGIENIWRQLLDQPINDSSDFLSLGGHSLLATQMVARVNKSYDMRLPVRLVFDHPTLGEFIAVARESRRAGPKGGVR